MKMNIDRLKTSEKLNTLAEYLPKVQPERFNMCRWGAGEKAPTWEALSMPSVNQCNTAACALGTAATLFEGLEFSIYTDHSGPPDYTVRMIGKKFTDSYEAGQRFFGITYAESKEIFSPLSYSVAYPNIAQVGARLRLVADRYAARGL